MNQTIQTPGQPASTGPEKAAKPTAQETAGFRKSLIGVRITIQARVGDGTMTVGRFLSLGPGSVLRSSSRPGGRILLYAGRILLASADPVVDEGSLVLRIEETGASGATDE